MAARGDVAALYATYGSTKTSAASELFDFRLVLTADQYRICAGREILGQMQTQCRRDISARIERLIAFHGRFRLLEQRLAVRTGYQDAIAYLELIVFSELKADYRRTESKWYLPGDRPPLSKGSCLPHSGKVQVANGQRRAGLNCCHEPGTRPACVYPRSQFVLQPHADPVGPGGANEGICDRLGESSASTSCPPETHLSDISRLRLGDSIRRGP